MTENFRVEVRPERVAAGLRYTVVIVRCGTGQGLTPRFADKARAERVAAFLEREMRPEQAREDAEIEQLVRAGRHSA